MRPRVGMMQGTSPSSGVDPWDLVETNEADEEDEDEHEDDAWGDPWGPGVTVGYDDTQCVDAWMTQTSDSESHDATQAEDVGRLKQKRKHEQLQASSTSHQASRLSKQRRPASMVCVGMMACLTVIATMFRGHRPHTVAHPGRALQTDLSAQHYNATDHLELYWAP